MPSRIRCTTAGDAHEASLLVLELNAHGIDASASHDAGSAAFGELPASVLHVRVQVPEAQVEAVRSVLAGFLDRRARRDDPPRAPWTCAGCGESNAPAFDLCWNCQAAAPSPPSVP